MHWKNFSQDYQSKGPHHELSAMSIFPVVHPVLFHSMGINISVQGDPLCPRFFCALWQQIATCFLCCPTVPAVTLTTHKIYQHQAVMQQYDQVQQACSMSIDSEI